MALNAQYDEIGKGFVQQYYAIFDDPGQRPNLINMYNTETSFMTFEGHQIQGSVKIMEKLSSLSFQKINRIITAVDSQPMFDGGVIINVLGRLQVVVFGIPNSHLQNWKKYTLFQTPTKNITIQQADDDPPHPYSQIFVLKPLGTSFYCAHDIFRLGIHNTA